MTKTEYANKLRDPRWQQKRLVIFQRDEFTCRFCGSKDQELHCHHKRYKPNTEPWDYSNDNFLTLCCACHQADHAFRKGCERKLLDALLDLDFSTHDVDNLAEFFASGFFTKIHHVPEVAVSALVWAADGGIGDQYHAFLASKSKGAQQ